MIKAGDIVRVDGKEATVQGSYGAGAHLMWKLSDGREILDLHKAVEGGAVQLVKELKVTPPKKQSLWNEPLPTENSDFEE